MITTKVNKKENKINISLKINSDASEEEIQKYFNTHLNNFFICFNGEYVEKPEIKIV